MKEVRQQTPTEEIINAVSHGIGLLLAVVGFIILFISASNYDKAIYQVGIAIFGTTLIALYFASMMYHLLPRGRWKDIFHMFDHISIYLLIAGTYAPVTLIAMPDPWKWTIFSVIWGTALVGIILKIFWFNRFRYFSLVLYVVMGWMIIVAIKPLTEHVNSTSLWFLAAGGVFYMLGIIFYVWKNLKFSHSIWHLFVLGGSMCHFFMVYHILPA
jgi:hemolysin III